MNWNDSDTALLRHFRKLGAVRRAHPAIATGRQKTLDTHTCLRYDDRDSILIRVKPEDGRPIYVGDTFADGTVLSELYTGQTAAVAGGAVTFPRFENRIAIIRRSE